MKKTPRRWILDASDKAAVALGYYFDESKGLHAVAFIEGFCRQSKGRWGGQPLRLMEWQRLFIMRLFGWRRPDGRRRFKTAYLEVPKKNGKSTLISAIALYVEVADGEKSPEVYLNAVDRDQASIVFDEMKRMVQASPSLSSRFEIIDSRKIMLDAKIQGKIRANSADVSKQDGVNASCVIWDELHRQKDRELWKIFQYAGISRDQYLRIVITTAGESESGPWHEQREYSQRVSAGTVEDPHHLGIVYAMSEGDDPEDPEVWARVNPSMGEIFTVEDFAADYEKAKEEGPDETANFLRLRLGKIIGTAKSFLTLEEWDRCGGDLLPFGDSPAYLGVDLSTVDDLTALVLAVGDEADGFDLKTWFFLPESNAAELGRRHKVPYLRWAEMGLVTLTPGEVVDYGFIRQTIRGAVEGINLRKVVSDPFNAYKLALELRDEDGLSVEFLRQGFLSLSGPTKDLVRLVKSGKIRHAKNPVLRWMIGNARKDEDAAGNIKLSKKTSRGKIDGLAATINALAGSSISTSDESNERSVYEDRGMVILG
jgi:phage terminase large subunit-like protein